MFPSDLLLSLDPAPAADAGGSIISSLPMLLAFVAIFYFVLLRPQQKEAKQQAELVASLQKGDRVVTSAGIHGTIHEAKGETLVIEIATNSYMTVDRAAVRRKAGAEPTKGA